MLWYTCDMLHKTATTFAWTMFSCLIAVDFMNVHIVSWAYSPYCIYNTTLHLLIHWTHQKVKLWTLLKWCCRDIENIQKSHQTFVELGSNCISSLIWIRYFVSWCHWWYRSERSGLIPWLRSILCSKMDDHTNTGFPDKICIFMHLDMHIPYLHHIFWLWGFPPTDSSSQLPHIVVSENANYKGNHHRHKSYLKRLFCLDINVYLCCVK